MNIVIISIKHIIEEELAEHLTLGNIELWNSDDKMLQLMPYETNKNYGNILILEGHG